MASAIAEGLRFIWREIVSFTAPIRIESEMNRREHWTKRRRRFQDQVTVLRGSWPRPRFRNYADDDAALRVTLTRIAPRAGDSDNIIGGFKAIRDEIARTIGRDDGDASFEWVYAQARGKPREYAIRVSIETRKS